MRKDSMIRACILSEKVKELLPPSYLLKKRARYLQIINELDEG